MFAYLCHCNQVRSFLSERRYAQLVLTLSNWNQLKPYQSMFCCADNRLISVWNESMWVASPPVCVHPACRLQDFNKSWFVWLTVKSLGTIRTCMHQSKTQRSISSTTLEEQLVQTKYIILNNIEHDDGPQHNHQGVQLSYCRPTIGDSGDDCMKNTRRSPHYQALRGIQWQGPKNSGFLSGLSEKVALYRGIQNLRDNITDLSALLWLVLRWRWIINRQEILAAIRFSYSQDIKEDSKKTHC